MAIENPQRVLQLEIISRYIVSLDCEENLLRAQGYHQAAGCPSPFVDMSRRVVPLVVRVHQAVCSEATWLRAHPHFQVVVVIGEIFEDDMEFDVSEWGQVTQNRRHLYKLSETIHVLHDLYTFKLKSWSCGENQWIFVLKLIKAVEKLLLALKVANPQKTSTIPCYEYNVIKNLIPLLSRSTLSRGNCSIVVSGRLTPLATL